MHMAKPEPAKKSGGLFGLFSKSKKKASAPPPPPPPALRSKARVTKSVKEERKLGAPAVQKRKKKMVEKDRASFRPVGEDADERYEQEIDSNVMSINFDVLKELGGIASGDVVFCEKCNAAFNAHSRLLDRKEIEEKKKSGLGAIKEEEEE